MRFLVVDDDLIRHEEFERLLKKIELSEPSEVVHTYTSQEAIHALKQQYFDVIYLDHDLGDNEVCKNDNTIPVAKFLCTQEDQRGKLGHYDIVFIHSLNPVGARNLFNILKDMYRLCVARIPYIQLLDSLQGMAKEIT